MAGRSRMLLVLLLLGAGAAQGASVRRLVALKSKLVITGAGPEIPNATILIQDGIITEVGPADRVKIPWNADVIDARDKVVMPGYVLAHTSDGLERENESMPDTPFLCTYDAIDPFRRFFKHALRNGITTILVLPGNRTRFGGMGTIVKPVGKTVDSMLIRTPYGLKISLSPAGGLTRMGHMQRLRERLDSVRRFLKRYEERKKEAKQSGKLFKDEIPFEMKPLKDLLEGKLLAFVYCPLASDVIRALELIKEYKFRAVLVLGRRTYRAASVIGRAKLPVILPPDIVFMEEDPLTGKAKRRVLPVIFRKAGVRFAFQIDWVSYDARYPWQVAAEAVKYGLSKAEAIRAFTVTPAEIIGMGRQVGQIRKGFRANLQLLTGDPLDPRTWVDKVLIDGEVVYDRAKDEYLKELLGKKEHLETKKK